MKKWWRLLTASPPPPESSKLISRWTMQLANGNALRKWEKWKKLLRRSPPSWPQQRGENKKTNLVAVARGAWTSVNSRMDVTRQRRGKMSADEKVSPPNQSNSHLPTVLFSTVGHGICLNMSVPKSIQLFPSSKFCCAHCWKFFSVLTSTLSVLLYFSPYFFRIFAPASHKPSWSLKGGILFSISAFENCSFFQSTVSCSSHTHRSMHNMFISFKVNKTAILFVKKKYVYWNR